MKLYQNFLSYQLLLLLGLFLIGCIPQINRIYIEEPITEHSLLHEIYDAMTASGNSYGSYPKFYLWKDKVNPTKHYLHIDYTNTNTSVLNAANRLITDLRYCVNENNCEDPFSAVYTKAQIENLNANFATQSFGFFPHIYKKNGSLFIIIREVLPYSPFSKAGIDRGDRILSFNGVDATDSFNEWTIKHSFNNSDYLNQSVNIQWRSKKNNRTYQKSIRVSSYTTSDIINTDDSINNDKADRFHNTVVTVTNLNDINDVQKVGYLIYKGYTKRSERELMELFAYWNKKGVHNNAIIDLRYNGGGSVDIAQKFISLLTSNNISSDFVTRLIYNNLYTSANRIVPFVSSEAITLSMTNKLGQTVEESLSPQHNFKNLYFLVGNGTASASEMTIIGVKPFVNTVLIGETTTGKGVGQSPYLDRKNEYSIRLINFSYANTRGEKVSRTGLIPDHLVESEGDNIKPWGHGEPLFNEAVRKIFNPNASMATTSSPFQQVASSSKNINKTNDSDIQELDWYKDNYQRMVGF